MKIAYRVAFAVLLLTSAVPIQRSLAKDPPDYEKGVLLSMESTACGYAENGGKTVTGEILGTDSAHKKTQELLCQEYVMQAKRLTYRIRPKDEKHPALLPVGEEVRFRIHKDKMYLLVPEGDQREREYIVLSMQLRPDVKDAKNSQ